MKKTSSPIVFFGSGPVASKSLGLLAQHFNIEAVVTKPLHAHKDEPSVMSLSHQLNVRQTYTVTSKEELIQLFSTQKTHSEIAVLVDFGIIIPERVINAFPLGIINSHFSLLPEWRGADPITFAILSGQKQTGVSLMLLVEKMDEGPILAQSVYRLPTDVTSPALTEALIELSDAMLTTTIPLYLSGELIPMPQDSVVKASYSRKLKKSDGLIDWNKPASEIEREIRAYIEWPKSYTTIGAIPVIITRAHVSDLSGPAGNASTVGKELVIFCGKGSLTIDKLKPANRVEMTSNEFLSGFPSIREI